MTLNASQASDLFRNPPERFIDVGYGEFAYRKVGSGPDVLFVHGWPVHSATFRTLLPYLADHLTCHLIEFPGAGSSRFDAQTPLSIEGHIQALRKVVDVLGLDQVAVVGHDSGGMIARHALAGDPRIRAFGLLDTEQTHGLSLKFRSFIGARGLPGFGRIFGWIAGRPRLRRNPLALGDAFADSSLLDGEFDEFFLRPISSSHVLQDAAAKLLRSFDVDHVRQLADLHKRINVPVQLVWGAEDRFFPVAWAEEMVGTFADARLHVVPNAGLFAHEERPQEVAKALLPVLTGRN